MLMGRKKKKPETNVKGAKRPLPFLPMGYCDLVLLSTHALFSSNFVSMHQFLKG